MNKPDLVPMESSGVVFTDRGFSGGYAFSHYEKGMGIITLDGQYTFEEIEILLQYAKWINTQ